MNTWHGVISMDVHEMLKNMNWLDGCTFA